MFEVVLILVLIAFDLGGSMIAHKSCVEVNFWFRLMFWVGFSILLYNAGLFDVLMN